MTHDELRTWRARLVTRERGEIFCGLPVRWLKKPHFRCTDGHVAMNTRDGHCVGCDAPCVVTFPEDDDGPPPSWIRSACVIVERDGRVAAIRSYKNQGRLQLPGGKAEGHETPEENARRETLEEVGLSLALELTPILLSDVGGFACTTFVGESVGDLVSSPEGEAVWVTPTELLKQGVYQEHTLRWIELLERLPDEMVDELPRDDAP